MIRTPLPTKLLVVFLAAILGPLTVGRPAVAGGFFWHHGHWQTTQTTGTNVVIVPAQNVQMVQMVRGQSFQTSAQPLQILQVSPSQNTTQPVMSLGTAGNYYVVQSAAQSNVAVATQANGSTITLSTSPTDPVTDNDRIVLSAAYSESASGIRLADGSLFRGNFTQFIEKFVQNQLQALIQGAGQALSNSDLEAQLLTLVNGILPAPFNTLLNPLIDGIIKRIIHNAVQNRGSTPSVPPTTPPSVVPPAVNPSGGAQVFDVTITGRLTLTPVSGTSPPPPPANGPTPVNPPATAPSIINNPLNEASPAPHPTR